MWCYNHIADEEIGARGYLAQCLMNNDDQLRFKPTVWHWSHVLPLHYEHVQIRRAEPKQQFVSNAILVYIIKQVI